MPSTFFGLNIGTTGLNAFQSALNTTSHNIANADTEGYSRQVTKKVAGDPLSATSQYGMVGTGVKVTGIDQERNLYYDEKYWRNSTLYGEYTSKEYYMSGIENYFKETGAEGITATFDKLYNSITSLSTDASNRTIRTQVTNYAKSFTSYVNYLSDSLKSVQEECNTEINNTVNQINSIAKQLAALNKQINTMEVNGSKANDLRDSRSLLVDQLSELANTSVSERIVGDGIGINQYVVKIDGKVLVDSYDYNELVCEPSKNLDNMNNVEGLYNVKWKNGQNFNTSSPSLGGKIQALFEVRDGNNLEGFSGTANAASGTKTMVITNSSINNVNTLNIPASDGNIKVGNDLYEYESFDVSADADGNFTYTFKMKNNMNKDVSSQEASIGKNVDYKGIPYYMSQLNQFVRTFSSAFNAIHSNAQDLNGNQGLDFFNGTNAASGKNYILSEASAPFTFHSEPSVVNNQASYYSITASNFTVTEEVLKDPSKVASATLGSTKGAEDTARLKELLALKSDIKMFKQGTPDSFLRTLTAEVGIDSKKAQTFSNGQKNIMRSIDNQRMSVSGVDVDEEAMNLVKFQNAYNMSAKVISVMNEIYDKLINQMGV